MTIDLITNIMNNFTTYFLQNHIGSLVLMEILTGVFFIELFKSVKNKNYYNISNKIQKIKVILQLILIITIPITFFIIDILQIFLYNAPIIYFGLTVIMGAIFIKIPFQ